MQFYTIGVYYSTEQEYFKKLTDNQIDTFCDIRQRRGVRGSQYIFVNSNRLQSKLNDLNIKYDHVTGLAPTNEIRELQHGSDVQTGEGKRSRNKLSKVFTIAYKDRILSKFDIKAFIEKLEQRGALNVVFFCVEQNAEACHRSLVGEKFEKLGYKIIHL